MTDLIDLDSLLKESMLQAAARKLTKSITGAPYKSGPNAKAATAAASAEVLETAEMLRQWDHKREWSHTHNLLVFTRQKCTCCEEMSITFDGMFIQLTNNRVKGTRKIEPVTHFDLDKPKDVVYRDSLVPICHECADIQQDWPLQGD